MAKKIKNIDFTKPPKAGHLFIDVVNGIEGPSLSIGDEGSGFRLAGPKAWGGGRVLYRFQVSISELLQEIREYERGENRDE